MKNMNCKRMWIVMVVVSVLVIAGCGRSGGVERPRGAAVGDIFALDWDEISEETDELFVNEKEYPMDESVNYNLDEENKVFRLVLFVKEGTDRETGARYAVDVAKGINDLAAEQDSYFEYSREDSYGGLYEKMDLHLMVVPGGPDTAVEEYLVDQVVPAGSYEEVRTR